MQVSEAGLAWHVGHTFVPSILSTVGSQRVPKVRAAPIYLTDLNLFFLQLCGVWQKIPTVYLQYFRQERLFAVITASKYPDGLVAGRIVPNDMTATGRFANNI